MRSNKRERDILRRWERARKWADIANHCWDLLQEFPDDTGEETSLTARYNKIRWYAIKRIRRALFGRKAIY